MGISDKKQESKQTSQTANTYGFENVPDTPDIIAARNDTAQIDPSIGYRLGEKERQLDESLASPTGAYVTPQIRDAIKRSNLREMQQQAGEQAREGQFDVNRLNQQRKLALAGITRPILTQQSSTSTGTGTVKQSTSPYATIATTAAQTAPLSL